jgi:hypothetical protein
MALKLSVLRSGETLKLTDTTTNRNLIASLLVAGVDVLIRPGSPVQADILIGLDQTEVEAEVVRFITVNPATGKNEQISDMRFADGTLVSFLANGSMVVRHETPAITVAAPSTNAVN